MKTIFTIILALLLISSLSLAQDTLYIYKGGAVVSMRAVADIDSITFYKPGSTVTDIEGNVYKTVKIGSQVWIAENLKTRQYNDGTAIPLVTDGAEWNALSTPGYCWYNNDATANKATYGALYNWYTVNTGKLCPTGWHVPTDAEWKTLEMYLGMTQAEADSAEWRGTDQGTQLKNTKGWNSGGNGTNTSGFSALPGGGRDYDGIFSTIGNYGFWWSSNEYDTTNAWYRKLYPSLVDVYRNYYYKQSGLSVRCLKDEM